MATRGKIVALSTVAVGVVVLIVAAIVGKEWIREEWYLWRLDKGGEQDQMLATQKLGEMRSARAVKPLMAKLKQVAVARRRLCTGDKDAIEDLLGELEEKESEDDRSFAAALIKIGKPTTLEVLKALVDEEQEPMAPFSRILHRNYGDPPCDAWHDDLPG